LVIILTIALVNSQILTLRQSLGIVMGSNIGTTLVTQIIAFKLSDYASLILLGGFLWLNVARKPSHKHLATILICIGLIFFGLEFMDLSVAPLRHYPPFTAMMLRLENPMLGVLIGWLFTLVIQASSATVAIAISLASQDLIGLPAGIALMMGAEIGTCSDTLLATLGRSRQAIRTGIFHLFFNVFSVVVGVLCIQPFTDFIVWLSGEASVSRKIANAHLFFNIGGVILLAGFTSYFIRFLEWLVPDKRKTTQDK
jgi:phosphate:Na+ symporter